jgi:hypothetical protein
MDTHTHIQLTLWSCSSPLTSWNIAKESKRKNLRPLRSKPIPIKYQTTSNIKIMCKILCAWIYVSWRKSWQLYLIKIFGSTHVLLLRDYDSFRNVFHVYNDCKGRKRSDRALRVILLFFLASLSSV